MADRELIETGPVRWDGGRRQELMAWDSFDNEHGLGAERALDLSCGSRLWWRRSDVEQQAATQQRSGSLAVGEEAEVPDANQTLRRNVDEESSQELVR